MRTAAAVRFEEVDVRVNGANVKGDLSIPVDAVGLVVFAHGSGNGRHGPRNQYIADALHRQRLATLLFDLLTKDEARIDESTRHLRFDIAFLSKRLAAVIDWVSAEEAVAGLPVGLFGASTGAAAALVVAAARPARIGAVVCRGGRPDLAMPALSHVRAPTLLIIGGGDLDAIPLNERAFRNLASTKELVLVDRATQQFEEPGALDEVNRLATSWFERHLAAGTAGSPAGIAADR